MIHTVFHIEYLKWPGYSIIAPWVGNAVWGPYSSIDQSHPELESFGQRTFNNLLNDFKTVKSFERHLLARLSLVSIRSLAVVTGLSVNRKRQCRWDRTNPISTT